MEQINSYDELYELFVYLRSILTIPHEHEFKVVTFENGCFSMWGRTDVHIRHNQMTKWSCVTSSYDIVVKVSLNFDCDVSKCIWHLSKSE